jgi:hypothetical protein
MSDDDKGYVSDISIEDDLGIVERKQTREIKRDPKQKIRNTVRSVNRDVFWRVVAPHLH